MYKQLTLFDLCPASQPEPDVGAYVLQHGAVICRIMRPGYIGRKVVYDCSTQSHEWYRCGVLEDYVEHEGHMRSIIYVGTKQRILFDHRPGREIFECLPWDAYPERMAAIGRRGKRK